VSEEQRAELAAMRADLARVIALCRQMDRDLAALLDRLEKQLLDQPAARV
jgi:hypothetical protein